ncbi:MAG TPA: 3-oxoacyl-ACP reductase family protein [Nitrospirota bacterium]|nr:3-oxoacyl-ACP reductase family protein [Nitrospirota bacterium]
MGSRELIGKTALVTGSSRGIGKAIALALAEAGADVAVNYREHEGEAQDACGRIKGLGRRCTAVQANVSSASDVARLVETIRRDLGTVTILVNNAGIARTHTLNDITEQDWDALMNVNLRAAFLMTQAVVSGMKTARWGRIINISSTAAQTGGVVGPHYAASKAGLIGLTHYYASHLAKEGITVNTIAPGPVRSDMSANLPQLNPSMVPVGRFGEPEEVATVAVLLALNGYITGQTINVNGGRYMS